MIAKVNQKDFGLEKRRLDKLFSQIAKESMKVAIDSADEYVELVKSGIGHTYSPPFSPFWSPLSEMWKAVKTANKDKFWLETGGIYNAVRTKIIHKSTKLIHVFAGIMRDTDNDAFERAERNEYGLGLGPARPLFEPAKDEVSEMMATGRRLKSNRNFINALSIAIKKVYRR